MTTSTPPIQCFLSIDTVRVINFCDIDVDINADSYRQFQSLTLVKDYYCIHKLSRRGAGRGARAPLKFGKIFFRAILM